MKKTHRCEPDYDASKQWYEPSFEHAKVHADDYLTDHPEAEYVMCYPVSDPFAPPDYEVYRPEPDDGP